MKFKKTIAVLLASAMAMPCVVSLAACGDETQTGTPGNTAYGNKTLTDAVKTPSNDVTIKLIRGKNVLEEAKGTLSYDKALQAGDIIEIESDYQYINVKLFDNLGEQLIYSPSGQFTFQIPSTATQAIYQTSTFGGTSYTFTASKATDAQVAASGRNLAVNPYDFMYIDEKNDQTKADNAMDEKLVNSSAVESGQVTAYPHAYANRVTRNEIGFFARNAIDGVKQAEGHGNYPYQSWGYDQKSDAKFTVYFGREVTINEVGFVLRADYSKSGNLEHDTYWDSVTLQFDDSEQTISSFEKNGELQKFSISEVTTTSVRIKAIQEVQNSASEMYAALTEFEAYGKEKVTANQVAQKTYITSAFGGKDQTKFSTSDYKYADIKATMDKSIDWFLDKTENTNYQIPDYNGSPMTVKLNDAGWKDAVYYSGLSEAFFTTGDMEEYYFLRGVGNQFKYLNDNGNHTPHGDNYQIGETYLQLNDLRRTEYKQTDTIANAEYNLSRDMNDKTPPKVSGSEWIDPNRDWSHMGFWWCDSLYMAMNTYTLLSRQTGDERYVDAAHEGYAYWKEELYNTKWNLWHRDSAQFEDWTTLTDEDGNKVATFWARGNAWVLAALAKQLMYLDESSAYYAEYKQDYLDIAAALAKYQRDDGTWNASIIDEKFYGGTESTGTMGFIYAYCVGLRLGILDKNTYYPIVKKAWDGIVDKCIFEDGQVGYMQTTGYQPKNYDSEETSKNNTHEFGMGLFLLACSGMMSICSDYTPATYVIPADPQAALIG